MSSEFVGKVAIVTGASSGLGQATAILMAQRGASITLSGRNEKRLDEVAKECVKVSQHSEEFFLKFPGDISKAEVREQLVEKTIEKFGQLDVLVNNAGTLLGQGDVLDMDEEGYDMIMNVNLKATFFLSKAAAPYLKKTGGCIVNNSSNSSMLIAARFLIYSISKAALNHMTRTLALGLASMGIRVNAVVPSYVPGTGIDRETPVNDEVKKRFVASELALQPLYGTLVTGEAIAKSICFLASEEARFITGQCLIVDGGRTVMGPVQETL